MLIKNEKKRIYLGPAIEGLNTIDDDVVDLAPNLCADSLELTGDMQKLPERSV